MNKKLYSALILGFLATGLFAQEGVKFGIRVSPGINLAQIVNDSSKLKIDGLLTQAKMGIATGLMLNFGFSETAALHTGLHILNRGYKSATDVTDTADVVIATLESNQSIMAVEIPLGIRLRSPEIGTGIFITAFFGGAAELNIKNKRVYDEFDTSTATIDDLLQLETRDIKEVNLVTASFVVGAGVDWEFDWGTLVMGASYHGGLMNILNKGHQEDLNLTTILNGKLSYIALDLGYFF